MAFVRRSLLGAILIVQLFSTLPASAQIPLNVTTRLQLIDRASEILCGFRTKTFYVYFESDSSLSFPSQILHEFSRCGVSYVSLRNNRGLAPPLEAINDDGILMFLVIVLRDASQPLDVSIIRKRSAAKHLSHVLLLVQDAAAITRGWLQSSFHKFWLLWVLKVVIIFWRHDELQVFRYNPFQQQFAIQIKANGDEGALPGLTDLFPVKLPNMNREPLRVCMFTDEVRAVFDSQQRGVGGNDVRMMTLLAERLNATPIVHLVSPFANRSNDICFSEVSSELDDMALNIRFLSASTFQGHVENTIAIERNDLCVLVPKANTASMFWNLFRSFKVVVWLAVLLSVGAAYAFLNMVFGKEYIRHPLLKLFASTLSLPWTWMPRNFALRLFICAWFVYGLLISNAYRGNLTSTLVFRTYLPDVNSIQDLAMSPYNIAIFARYRKHITRFLNASNHYENLVLRKMVDMPDEVLTSHLQSNNLTYAYVQKQHLATFQASARSHSHLGRPLYHVMSTCLVPFHAVYIMPYGSPYLGFLNKVSRSASEFGLGVYWNRMAAVRFFRSGRAFVRGYEKDDSDPVVLKMDHLWAAFCLWITGLFCAFVVFLWEIKGKRK